MKRACLFVLFAIGSGCALSLFVGEGSHWPEAGPPAEPAKANERTPSRVPAIASAYPLAPSSAWDREARALEVADAEMEYHETPERILILTLSRFVSREERAKIEAAWRAGDFAGAAALAAALANVEDRRKVLVPLLGQWTKTDPKAAVRFAEGTPAGVERQEMLGAAIRAWSEHDLIAASDWLNVPEPLPDHDLAVAAIASSEPLCLYQPEAALSWAESITASAVRWEVMSFVVTLWAQRDASAARVYIETSAVLTAEERTRMLSRVAEVASWTE